MMISEQILSWYDNFARKLVWRVSPEARKKNILPNPYYVWLSEIMLQQTTVATVKDYYQKFIQKWPTIFDLAAASQDDIMAQWAGLGYYSRARNLHKTAQIIVDQYQGNFPKDEQSLLKLPGIGPYSAASISAISFDVVAAVMDGNIERIISRLYMVNEPLPKAKKQLYELVKKLTPQKRSGDYAQAMMDLGATICTPKKPICHECPIQSHCQAFKVDQAELYPKKLPKVKKTTHQGAIFLFIFDDKILVEKRPDYGLFAGMTIFPYLNPHEILQKRFKGQKQVISTDMSVDKMVEKYIDKKNHRSVIGRIKHVFTHFTLHADIIMIKAPKSALKSDIQSTESVQDSVVLVDMDQLETLALPTLMTKAFKKYQEMTQNLGFVSKELTD